MLYRKALILLGLGILFAGCSSAPPTFQTGPEAEVTYDGLTRVDNTKMHTVWARTDIDLSSYTKVRFESVDVEYRPVKGPYSGRAGMASTRTRSQDTFPMDDATRKLVAETIFAAFQQELAKSDKYTMIDIEGPDVLTVRASLLDVVSQVPPETMGRSSIYIDKVGEATLVLELYDSESNAILARSVDRRAAERSGTTLMSSNPVSNKAEVTRLGRTWGTMLRSGLESLLAPQ
jgi:hypothetical protein